MNGAVGLLGAFAAGMVSFLSPCVLPLVPAWVSFITGLSLAELGDRRGHLSVVLVPSLLFVAGLAIVFVSLGASASVLGALLAPYKGVLSSVAGVFVALMGFLLLGVVKVPWLYAERRMDPEVAKRFGGGAALVLGVAFGFGWTPCVGPILASILALAGSSGSVARGAALLLVYALGLGVPFVAVGLFFGRLGGMVRWLSRHTLAVNRVAGALLIVIGVLMATGKLAVLAGILYRVLPLPVG